MPLLDDLRKLIKDSTESVNDKVKAAESELIELIEKLLNGFLVRGSLESSDSDFQIFKRIEDLVRSAIIKSGYVESISDLVPVVDQIEEIGKDIIQNTNPRIAFNKNLVDLTQDKKLAISKISNSLSSPMSIKINIADEIQQIIYSSIQQGITLKESISVLEPLIVGDSAQGGLLSRYYKGVAKDSLYQWHGVVNDRVGVKYGLIDYQYSGSIRTTTRPQCYRWVRELNSILIKEVIEREMQLARRTIRKSNSRFQGYSIYAVPSLASFPKIRGGHNCGHTAIPFLATEEQAAASLEKYNSLYSENLVLKFQEIRAF